ncbi:MAG TPA: hypothetical protein VGL94_05845 [Ktedonobacteraceae bacterium]|jgi:hypothetical protein
MNQTNEGGPGTTSIRYPPLRTSNDSSSPSNGQGLNEPRSFKQALINLFPRDFYSLLFGSIAGICTWEALTTNNMTLLWSVWASVGLLVGIVPRARQGFNWAKDHLQLKDPSDTSLNE